MRTYSYLIIALFAATSVAACTQTICSDGSGGNCQSVVNGTDGGDEQEVACDDPNLTSCDSTCVDTDVSPDFCGSCDNTCSQGQGCSAGECVNLCEPGEVNCGGECIDPQTSGDFCGASGTCTGQNIGTDCGDDPCNAGVCVKARYVGSLAATTGRWNFGATPGIAGAELACQTLYAVPTATVCSFDDLVVAQNQVTGSELINATDDQGNPVTEWHIVDPGQNALARQCIKTDGENLPWTYPTADLGQGSVFATLNATAGTVSQPIDAPPSTATGCGALRFVPCCIPPTP